MCYEPTVFTGLIKAIGSIASRSQRGAGARLAIACPFPGLVLGESISVSGVCLTVDALTRDGFEADASAETLAKTTLGALAPSARVNLERALTLADRLGGHLVSGHVDGVGELALREPLGEAERLVVRPPRELARFIAAKGSITVDGISLTVNDVSQDGTFGVAIIPRTRAETCIEDVPVGGRVNLEVDVLARYVLRALEVKDNPSVLEVLRENGYIAAEKR